LHERAVGAAVPRGCAHATGRALWQRDDGHGRNGKALITRFLGADLLLDYPCTTGNVGGLILQVFSAADSLDLVDGDKQARK